MAKYICVDEEEEPRTKNMLSSKYFIQIWWINQKLYRHSNAKRIQHHQNSFTTNTKGTSQGGKEKDVTVKPEITNEKAHQ